MRGPAVIVQQLPQTSCNRRKGHFDRGAAAVEMALVLPVPLFILMGLIDFGRAYNAQIQLSAAAREGVRLASLNTTADTADASYGNTAIENRVHAAAGGVPTFTVVNSAANAASCPATSNSVCIVYCPAPARLAIPFSRRMAARRPVAAVTAASPAGSSRAVFRQLAIEAVRRPSAHATSKSGVKGKY
jgi:Flp pilus assembly protein TadG